MKNQNTTTQQQQFPPPPFIMSDGKIQSDQAQYLPPPYYYPYPVPYPYPQHPYSYYYPHPPYHQQQNSSQQVQQNNQQFSQGGQNQFDNVKIEQSMNIGMFDQQDHINFYQQDGLNTQQLQFYPEQYDDQVQVTTQPLETILEDSQELDGSSSLSQIKNQNDKVRGLSEDQKKKFEANKYLKKVNKKIDEIKQNQVKEQVQKDISKAIELSQMSQWTNNSNIYNQKTQINERLRLKDKEQLIEELIELKKTNNIQTEEIKLLKAEVIKLKRKNNGFYFPQQPTRINNNENVLMEPNDLESCKEVIRQLKIQLNQEKDDSKILKLKNSELKKKLKLLQEEKEKISEEYEKMKLKYLQQQNARNFRDDYEKAQKQMKKLLNRLNQLEQDQEQKQQFLEIQKQIEESLRKEDEEKLKQDKENITKTQELSMSKNESIQENFEIEIEDVQKGDQELAPQSNDFTDSDNLSREESINKVKEVQIKQEQQVNSNQQTKDYVAATLQAWNQCPLIVKKQLDEQNKEIKDLQMKIKEYELKINLKKNDFDRVQGVEMKKELMKHKEKIESIYRQKLEDEKRKLLKGKMTELDDLMQENKKLKDECSRLKLAITHNNQ